MQPLGFQLIPDVINLTTKNGHDTHLTSWWSDYNYSVVVAKHASMFVP